MIMIIITIAIVIMPGGLPGGLLGSADPGDARLREVADAVRTADDAAVEPAASRYSLRRGLANRGLRNRGDVPWAHAETSV